MADPFLEHLERWAATLDAPGLEARFTAGPTDRDKIAAWVVLETPATLGQVTVWDSGEVELEALAKWTDPPLLLGSHELSAPAELAPLLDRLLAVVTSR